jgi:hypothetical protein
MTCEFHFSYCLVGPEQPDHLMSNKWKNKKREERYKKLASGKNHNDEF